MKDLHIHIERGPYTVEWIERFINQAIKMNMDEICLVEHSIRFKDFRPCFNEAHDYNKYQAHWVEEKEQTMHTLDEYKSLVNEIRSIKYPIKVDFGLEICYFPQHEEEIKNLVADNFFDYILGSVHWVDNWTFNQRKYQWLGKDVNKIYERYFELEKCLIKSDIFDIIAHPDLIRCHNIFAKNDMTDNYKEICKLSKEHNVKIEMNTSRHWKDTKCDIGINKDFLSVAKDMNVSFSTGSDAHRPEDVGKNIVDAINLIK